MEFSFPTWWVLGNNEARGMSRRPESGLAIPTGREQKHKEELVSECT